MRRTLGRSPLGPLTVLLACVLALAACGSSGGATSESSGQSRSSASATTAAGAPATPKRGGSAVSLLPDGYTGSWPTGLDPATNTTGGANFSQNEAIFGGLFQLRSDSDGTNAMIVPYQAASGTVSSDAMTLTVTLNKGMTFSDGTPFDAQAVIWNWQRDTNSKCGCSPTWQVRKNQPFTSPGPLTVVVHLSAPYAAVLNSFPATNMNWIVSPTAYKKMGGQAFKVRPVGAGPFTVVSDTLSTSLVLQRNPRFFKKGLPYLDKLTFKSVGGDQAGYQALLAGGGDVYEGMSTPPVIEQASKNSKLTVTAQPPTSPFLVQVNTSVAPFNNKTAREVLYYASDWQAINKGLFGGKLNVVQGFTTPVDLFYHAKTPGYRTYDLAKAKALVKALGGLSVDLVVPTSYTYKEVSTALQTQWQKAGITVRLLPGELNTIIKEFKSGTWQAALQQVGSWDPAVGVGVAFRFSANSPFSGVKDKHLDALLQQGLATADPAKRDDYYFQAAKYISDNAYASFGLEIDPDMVSVRGIHGPGLTTKIPSLNANGIIWAEVWKDNP